MKEVLTRKFWRDVKKTFDDARAEPPPPDALMPAGAKVEGGTAETHAASETEAPVKDSAPGAGTEPNP